MPRPKKKVAEVEPSDHGVTLQMPEPLQPIPVTMVQPAHKPLYNHPHIDEPIEKRNYRFVYNQNPGTPLEFSKGRTVMNKGGKPTIIQEKFCLEDDTEYELPVDVAKHLNGLIYYEQGQRRPRCSCIEVD